MDLAPWCQLSLPLRLQSIADNPGYLHTIGHMGMSSTHSCNRTLQVHTKDALEAPVDTVACHGSQPRADWAVFHNVVINDDHAGAHDDDHQHRCHVDGSSDPGELLFPALLVLFLFGGFQASWPSVTLELIRHSFVGPFAVVKPILFALQSHSFPAVLFIASSFGAPRIVNCHSSTIFWSQLFGLKMSEIFSLEFFHLDNTVSLVVQDLRW